MHLRHRNESKLNAPKNFTTDKKMKHESQQLCMVVIIIYSNIRIKIHFNIETDCKFWQSKAINLSASAQIRHTLYKYRHTDYHLRISNRFDSISKNFKNDNVIKKQSIFPIR